MPIITTSDRFPVQDITHKPRRTQSGNLRVAESENSPVITYSGESVSEKESIPVTLERAIKFYESEAPTAGNLAPLYKQTAVWLRILLDKSSSNQGG